MFVEIIGLPGSGKSTILADAAPRMKRRRIRFESLRVVAKDAIADIRADISFLHKRSERTSLYGCFAFAAEHPAVFDHLFQTARHDLARVLWNMEMLAQFHFVQRLNLDDTLVMVDEGFLHRGVASYLDSTDDAAFRDYNMALQHPFVTVHIAAPVAVALERAVARKKPVPSAVKGATVAQTTARMTRFAALIDQAVQMRRDKGAQVITIDATQSQEAASFAFTQAMEALVQAGGTAMRRPKKTKQAEDQPRA